MINANAHPLRKRSRLHPFRHTYPSIMPMHREREAEMIKNSKIAWISGLTTLIILLVAAFVLGTVQAQATTPSKTDTTASLTLAQYLAHTDGYNLPFCAHEDGSTQDLCMWDDKTGDQLVNMGFGTFTYNMSTGQMIDYRSGTGTVVEYER